MEKIKENFCRCLDPKFIISIMYSITACILATKGLIEMETFVAIIMSIITYYFTQKN